MTTRDTATALLALRLLKNMLADAEKTLRAQALVDFDVPGVRDMGLIGDEQIGSVQLNAGSETATVTDPAALLAWVEENRPGEVETTRSVRPAYVSALLAGAKAEGVAFAADTGLIIPGITVTIGPPTLTVRPASDGPDVLRRAFLEGRLSMGDVIPPPAIEGSQP